MSKIAGSTIFVSGGAGFVGSYVVDELLKHEPKKVRIMDNFIRGNERNMEAFINHPAVEFHHADIREHSTLSKCIEGSDFVFHMAALRINACAADPKEGFEVMLRGTFDLANLCVEHKVKKVIYSSSASIYGLAQHFPTPESDNPYNNQTFYGAAKFWGEQLFRSFRCSYGLDYLALRYFNVYGPRMDTNGKYTEVMIKWLDCIREKKAPEIFGDGCDSMDFVHVRDVAHSNILALFSESTDEAINIGSQVETNLQQLLHLLLEVNDSDLKPSYREVKTVNPVKRRLSDLGKAKRLLGYEPSISLEQGLKELSNWYFKK
jgi:UDP-glucose 4-epimerase